MQLTYFYEEPEYKHKLNASLCSPPVHAGMNNRCQQKGSQYPLFHDQIL